MKIKNVILIVFVCLLSVSVLGCGNTDSENTETNTEAEETESFDVCSLITKEEAESAIGMEVEEAVVTGQEAIGQKQCFYDGKELDASTGFVQIGILRAVDMPENVIDSGQTVNTIYNDLKDNDVDKEAVEGLGDDAFGEQVVFMF
ncbi:MAG: hypothetical protein JJE03_02810 [Peptostreptococcaceae bacterium]|nr:hypothetical protein [Peptostreptococcaceae bacterium]